MTIIVRIDKEEKTGSGATHGWQVRGRATRIGGKRGNYRSKMFSDNVYGSRGKALIAAEEFAESIKDDPEWFPPVGTPEHPPYHYNISRANKSGVNGVHRTKERVDKKSGQTKPAFWVATFTDPRNNKRRHKDFSVNEYGEAEAKRLAVEFRQMWEEAADVGTEAIIEFLEDYEGGGLST